MDQYYSQPIIAQGSNDIFVKIGWCPDVVKITEWATGLEMLWHRIQGHDTAITRVAAGDRTVQTAQGIFLCAIDGNPADLGSDPAVFTDCNFTENGKVANAVKLTSDLTGLTDHALCLFEAKRSSIPVFRGVHDGTTSSDEYFEDSSIDFKELGVSGGQTWIMINKTNNNYVHIGAVQKPSGKSKFCRLTSVTAAGVLTGSADFDTSDVIYVMQKAHAQYPLGDYGHAS